MKLDKNTVAAIEDEFDREMSRVQRKRILLLKMASVFTEAASDADEAWIHSASVFRRMTSSDDDVSMELVVTHLREKIDNLTVLQSLLKEEFTYEDGSSEEKIGVAFCSILDSMIAMCIKTYAIGRAGLESGQFSDPGTYDHQTIGVRG